jgi:menaquinone-dependent protoporphyrinogen IX oxidase
MRRPTPDCNTDRMATILILYGTKEGHTPTIAERMREAIAARGHEVTVERGGVRPRKLSPGLDGVVVGASVHAGKHQAKVREFAKRNRERLASMPSAFLQVCLTAADRARCGGGDPAGSGRVRRGNRLEAGEVASFLGHARLDAV